MEIFEIWATLNLKGDALKKMERFAATALIASETSTKLIKKMGLLSERFSKISSQLAFINPEFTKLAKNFSNINSTSQETDRTFKLFNQNMTSASRRTGTLINNTQKLAENLSFVAEKGVIASASLKEIGAISVMGTAGSGSSLRRHSGSMHMGLGGIPMGGLITANAQFAAPFAAYAVLKSGFTTGNEYQRLQGQLQALGYSQDQLGAVNQFVAGNQTPGVSRVQMLQAYIDAQMMTREKPDEAVGKNSEVMRLAPMLAKAQFAANVMYGGMSNAEMANLSRFAEIMGGSSVDKRIAAFDAATQIMVSSGGTIRPTELRTFERQAGGAFMNLKPEALVALEPVLQESGGAKLATGLVTGLRQLVTGTGSNFNKKQVQFLEHLGILSATYDSEGRPLGIHMKSAYEKTLEEDPYQFMKGIVLPLMKKSGINVTDPTQISHAFNLGFGRTMSNQLLIMWKNMQSIDRQLSQLHNIGGVNSQYQLALGQGAAAPKLVAAAWSDFSLAIGKLTNPTVILGLKILAAALEGVASAANYIAGTHDQRKAYITTQEKKQGSYTAALLGTGGGLSDYYDDKGAYSHGGSKPGAISSAPVSSSSSQNTHVNLNIDSRTFAQAVLPAITKSMTGGGTITGTSYTNIGLTPVSSNYTAVGSP